MAVRQSVSPNGAGNDRSWFVAACLVVLFVAALFLRAYWNLDAANPSEGEFVLSGGSDPYYHKRAIDAIQANGFQTLIDDPLLNYPQGSVNPNPPLYQWSVAVAGKLMEPFFGSLGEATWQATIWSPAIYGALTVLPVYFIGAALFSRRAGLIAALLWTLSTSAIDATGVGLADHDGTVMFFTSLAFLFYIKTIQRFRGDGNWVTRWRDGSAVSSGVGRLFRERRGGFAFALLTAMSIAAVALTWKGFNYVIGIIFVYAVLQMVIDHWRNRDSTGLFLATFLAMLIGVLVAYPYYAQAGVANFLQPTWFIIAGFVAAGLVLVPTRDLPSILVMPTALVVAAIAAVAAFFVFPTVAQSLLYATVYFKQTRLYQTIAEAQAADFSTMVFGIGPVAFFAALAGWIMLLFTARRHPTRAILFALVWGAVAMFMANSAVRFLFNAIPVFCVFAGYMADWVLRWLDFGAVRKSLAANRGNAWQGFRKGVRPLHVVAVILIALLFVIPTTILAADAALPPEAENRIASESDSEFVKSFMSERMGAYGQGFIPDYWTEGLEWLDQYDANITNPADRPAFLSWWDYGHWAISVGRHPAVADNFQNGYEFAANFILSQNETHAIQLLASRLAEMPNANLEAALTQAGSTDAAGDAAKLRRWEYLPDLDTAESAKLVSILEANTGKRIRYFAVDVRMFPYDNPQTPSIEQSSIYYAPVTLKGDDPDTYITATVNIGNSYVTAKAYEELARNPIRQTQAAGERLEYQQKFFNSMYWRAYVGTPVQPTPGQPTLGDEVLQALNGPRPAFAMEHFRLIYASDALKIIEYYPGATVTGTVTEEGQPVSGASIVAYDDAGKLLIQNLPEATRSQLNSEDFDVPHTQTTTGADGKFSLVAPFAMEGGNVTLVASRDGVEIGRAHVSVTREDANLGRTVGGADILVQRGAVEGIAFRDVDGNGQFNETNEQPVADLNVTIGGVSVTTGADGKYRIDAVSAGAQNVTTDATGLTLAPASSRVRVQPGATTTHNLALQVAPATVSGQLLADKDGDGVANDTIAFTTITFAADESVADNGARNATAFAGDGAAYSVTLQPGTYLVTANYTDAETGTAYALRETLVVNAGDLVSRDLVLAKSE